MNKRLKLLVMYVTLLLLTFQFSSISFASEKANQSTVTITPLGGSICPNCDTGFMLTTTYINGPFFEGTYSCYKRGDCIITEYRYYHQTVTKCSECSFGYVNELRSTYVTEHSIEHP